MVIHGSLNGRRSGGYDGRARVAHEGFSPAGFPEGRFSIHDRDGLVVDEVLLGLGWESYGVDRLFRVAGRKIVRCLVTGPPVLSGGPSLSKRNPR